MKRFSMLYLGAFAAAVACLAPPAARADDFDKKTIVTISNRTEVPGIILEPGTYVIKLLNSSSNRHIAEIMNEKMDHLYALTFTAAAEKVNRTGKTVLTFYEGSNDRPPALRKWFWPGDTIGQEFIYPKAQAVRISAATKEKVPEGDLPTVAGLNPDNAKGLSVEASSVERKEADVSVSARAAEPEKVAEPAPVVVEEKTVETQRSEPVVIAQNTPPPEPARVEQAPPPSPPAVSDDTAATSLPQTASPVYLIGAIGMVSLVLASIIGMFGRRHSVKGL
jgi:hypothetical protein